MPTFTLTHQIECDADTFWKVFFDKDFNRQLYLDKLGFPEFEVLEMNETDAQITRKAAGQPKLKDLPGPVAKLLGNSFRYTENGTFDKATKVWKWKMTPSTLADKMRQEGTLHLEPAGDKAVRRVVELVNEAKIFGVGGLLEKSAEKSLRDGWDTSAAFLNEWVKKL
jgi:hypothetical protein